MVLLVDLDGTLINTVHPSWKSYREGSSICSVDNIPFFEGSKEFVAERKQKGDEVYIISDSHPSWVEPVADVLGVDCLCLANKPNTTNIRRFLTEKQILLGDNVFFIGDSTLDIEIGRKLCINTIWILPYQISEDIKSTKDGVGDIMSCIKMGATYSVKSWKEMSAIIDNPCDFLYSIEGAFRGTTSIRPIVFSERFREDGTCSSIYCLARQEQGFCDKYSLAKEYYDFQKENRCPSLLSTLSSGVSTFINQDCFKNQKWDYFTYITDKETTVPRNKMRELFNMIDSHVEKIELVRWHNLISGSLRDRRNYSERRQFLELYMSINHNIDINGKNIIVLDDQLTTGATAWYMISKLKEAGAANVMFVTLFQMTLNVSPQIQCPQCGGQMVVKINRNNGKRFFSCIPPRFGGGGCGYAENID